MRDAVSLPVPLAWEKSKRRAVRGNGTAVGGRRAKAFERRPRRNYVAKKCEFDPVLGLGRLRVSGFYLLMEAKLKIEIGLINA